MDMTINVSNDEIQMVNRHVKKAQVLSKLGRMKIKTTMRFHLSPGRMAYIQESPDNNCLQGHVVKGTPIHCRWDCNWVQPRDIQCKDSLDG